MKTANINLIGESSYGHFPKKAITPQELLGFIEKQETKHFPPKQGVVGDRNSRYLVIEVLTNVSRTRYEKFFFTDNISDAVSEMKNFLINGIQYEKERDKHDLTDNIYKSSLVDMIEFKEICYLKADRASQIDKISAMDVSVFQAKYGDALTLHELPSLETALDDLKSELSGQEQV